MRTKVAGSRRGAGLLAVALLALGGCSLLPPLGAPPEEPAETPRLPPEPEPVPTVEMPEPPPTPEPAPEPELEPEPEPEPAPPARPPRVAVLLTARVPAYESVATALRAELGDADVYNLEDKSLTPRETAEAIRVAGTDVIVAVGYRAAVFAAGFEDLPVVYSQVFNTERLDAASDRIKGVAMLPPLDRQLEAWKALNPNLSSVGAIIGPGHERLLEEAGAAAAKHDVRFESRLAGSDRETLYLFTRLVPQIDGFWLFPDNRVLSADVLRKMLTYAARHRVQVAVFNDSLLTIGATLSTTPVDEDIARTILDVANRLLADEGEALPPISPLSEIEVQAGDAQVSSGADAGTGGDGD